MGHYKRTKSGVDNEAVYRQEIHGTEMFDEKLSLADRFGLWLSFPPFTQTQYLSLVSHWIHKLADKHALSITAPEQIEKDALRWAMERGDRSGRTAHHFARAWIGDQLYQNLD